MKKLQCVFVRKHINVTYPAFGEIEEKQGKHTKYLAIDEVNPGCEWVLNGEGIATIKWDGTAVMIDKAKHFTTLEKDDGSKEQYHDYTVYQRQDVRKNKAGIFVKPHDDAIMAHDLDDRKIWWVPATDKWIKEAFENTGLDAKGVGTFEAIGPKINGNRYKADRHVLVRHGWGKLEQPPRTYDGLREYMFDFKLQIPEIYEDWVYHEGIVFHHPDGRMAKLRRNDFLFDEKPLKNKPKRVDRLEP